MALSWGSRRGANTLSRRPAVFVTRRLPEEALADLRAVADVRVYEHEAGPVDRRRLLTEAAAADGLLCLLTERIDAELLAAAPQLKVCSSMSVGYDHIDVPACTARGVLVCNTPGVLTETTADLCWAILMACARRLYEAQQTVVEGRWPAWGPFFLAGQDVWGRTLGIIGLGRIGQAVARRAKGFGMRILYTGRTAHQEAEAETGAIRVPLPELLAEADFVVLLAALTPETRHLIGDAELARMKPSAVLVNAARGPLVDESALAAALREGRIWGAALDVFEREPIGADHPLLGLPNVTAVPHIGSASLATRLAMARLAADNLAQGLTGRRPRAPVNPQVLDSV